MQKRILATTIFCTIKLIPCSLRQKGRKWPALNIQICGLLPKMQVSCQWIHRSPPKWKHKARTLCQFRPSILITNKEFDKRITLLLLSSNSTMDTSPGNSQKKSSSVGASLYQKSLLMSLQNKQHLVFTIWDWSESMIWIKTTYSYKRAS